ncbi:hypothetical protein OS189_00415 [Sulfitobacter sp. F26169L]|uniref:hypothetical protein n=1 Tax=Sulfitobacter sp. F26169L TaxID=2996015 RepID=UPI0022608FEF|nr:hypothetical protein [Sulfitobacter sp. F26169L]MCX7564802.1 hypothetical protein [Sulfitobacter sp. F26169L]
MPDMIKKLEISQTELEVIAGALETQAKILRMQASAGGSGAMARLNEVKRVLASISSQREVIRRKRSNQNGIWGLLRSMGQAT